MNFANKTVSYLAEQLFDSSNLILNCNSKNATSQLLKDINIFIVDGSNSPSASSSEAPILNGNSSASHLRSDYDYNEALVYLIVTLFWYSVFVIALIFNQTKKSELQYLEDSQNATKYLLRGTRSEHVKREVLELLKGPGYMQKMNEIYFDNPNQYKIKRFEIKRIKQIDKKLKQYYSSNQNDYYKTFDTSQLDERTKSKSKMDANLFLLKDLHKLDTNSSSNKTTVTGLNPNVSKQNFDSIGSSNQQAHSTPSSPLLTGSFKVNTFETIKNNRFRVEKIKENV